MTHIPDEAVHAPERIRVAQDAEGFWTCREAISGSQEYIRSDLAFAHLSAPCAVEVKKLEWKNANSSDDTTKTAQSIFGEYCVWVISGSGYFRIPREYGGVPVNGGLEGAFAAAQADFERRVLSNVVTKPVDVAAVRRQALDALKKAEQFIENGVEFGFIKLPKQDDPALETLPLIKEVIRALSAEPAQ